MNSTLKHSIFGLSNSLEEDRLLVKEFGQGLSPENLLGIMVSKEEHLKKAEIYVQEATIKIGEELKVKKAHVVWILKVIPW